MHVSCPKEWGIVKAIYPDKFMGFCFNNRDEKFLFSLNYEPIKDVRLGDILEFVPHASRKTDGHINRHGKTEFPSRVAMHVRIIGYSVLEDAEPSQAAPVVAAQSKQEVNSHAGIQNSPRRAA